MHSAFVRFGLGPRAAASARALRLADSFSGLGMLASGGVLAYAAARER